MRRIVSVTLRNFHDDFCAFLKLKRRSFGTITTNVCQTNVIAVEVHQCNENSTDAWWNLGLSYARAGNIEGGIVVPPEGLTINARVLANGEAGEWSALSTIVVKGDASASFFKVEVSDR